MPCYALDFNGPTKNSSDDVVHDVQPQTGAALTQSGREEWLKDPVQILVLDALPRVVDRKFQETICDSPGAHRDYALL